MDTEKLRQVFFPEEFLEGPLAKDPMAVAWEYRGQPWENKGIGSTAHKLALLAVARIQAAGQIPTANRVQELILVRSVASTRNTLNWMCRDYVYQRFSGGHSDYWPLLRKKVGRTLTYWVLEPPGDRS